jgi:hypothetical protein
MLCWQGLEEKEGRRRGGGEEKDRAGWRGWRGLVGRDIMRRKPMRRKIKH